MTVGLKPVALRRDYFCEAISSRDYAAHVCAHASVNVYVKFSPRSKVDRVQAVPLMMRTHVPPVYTYRLPREGLPLDIVRPAAVTEVEGEAWPEAFRMKSSCRERHRKSREEEIKGNQGIKEKTSSIMRPPPSPPHSAFRTCLSVPAGPIAL